MNSPFTPSHLSPNLSSLCQRVCHPGRSGVDDRWHRVTWDDMTKPFYLLSLDIGEHRLLCERFYEFVHLLLPVGDPQKSPEALRYEGRTAQLLLLLLLLASMCRTCTP